LGVVVGLGVDAVPGAEVFEGDELGAEGEGVLEELFAPGVEDGGWELCGTLDSDFVELAGAVETITVDPGDPDPTEPDVVGAYGTDIGAFVLLGTILVVCLS
jgi:hypothetical protein